MTECSLLERDSGIDLLHHLQMSESVSLSDEGSPSSSSRFESAMSGSSWLLLESGTKETLDDPHNCQTLANIGSSSMLVGERVVCDAIPIFRSDPHTCQTLANIGSSSMLVGQLNPGFWNTLIGFYIIWMKCGLGEPSFHQWRYCYKMRPVKACTGYAKCACWSKREHVVFDKRKAYCTWKKRWCFLYNDWEHAKGVTPERRVPTHFQTVVTRGTIKLSGQELADVEKVLRVPKEDRHLGKLRPLFRKYSFQPLVSECQRRAMEKVGKKVETSTKKRRVPMLVPSEDILFHKEARKHRKAEVKAIGCAAAIVVGEDRRLLPPLPTINPIFPPVMEHIGQEGDPSSSNKGKDKEEVGSVPWKDLKVAMRPKDFGYINNCLAGRRFTFDELGELLAKDESDYDRMLKLFSYVMAEYHDRLREAERCKRRNGENLRLKVQLEATMKQLETTMLEVSKVKGELDSALVEVSELKSMIPTEKEAAVKEFLGSQAFLHVLRPRCTREVHFEKRKWMAVLDRYDDGSVLQKYREEIDEHHRKGETFDLAVYYSSADESGDEASADEQNHQGDDEFGDAENGSRTQSDMIRGSTSDEDD
ncbi:unnamed protein product [Malus baccata var. baccata]